MIQVIYQTIGSIVFVWLVHVCRFLEGGNSSKWQPRNWNKKTETQVKRMSKQQRSRYMAVS